MNHLLSIVCLMLIITGCKYPPIHYSIPDYPNLSDTISFDSLEIIASERIDLVKEDPHKRYEIREMFYEYFGDGHFTRFGFGNSELAFIKWEERGVLKPPHTEPPGSPWWSEVNLQFIYWSELAALIHLSGIDTTGLKLSPQVGNWLSFIENPTARHWYRAHNSSIIEAYHLHPHLAKKEILAEQVFMNMVLYRLLYAQAMVESERFAFGRLGSILAQPQGFAVDFIVHDPFFYPSKYPLTREEQDIILGKKHSVGELEMEFFDNVLILPHLNELYTTAATINGTPSLLKFEENGKPSYPHID